MLRSTFSDDEGPVEGSKDVILPPGAFGGVNHTAQHAPLGLPAGPRLVKCMHILIFR